MNNNVVYPCPEWSEKLAALHPADLSQSDYIAIEQHVQHCSACSAVRNQYQMLANLVHTLPASDLPSDIPPRLAPLLNNDQVFSNIPFSNQKAQKRRSFYPLWISAIAAVLIVGLLLGVILHFAGSSPQNGSGTTTGAATVIAPLPALYQSTLFVSNGTLHAFRSNTGLLIRSYTVGDAPLASPAIVNSIAYISTRNEVYALRLGDGSVLWHDDVGQRTLLPPGVANGIVYVLSSGTTLDALSASNGKLLWQYQAGGSDEQVGLPVVINGIAYIGVANPDSAYVEALNTVNGALLWRHEVGTTYTAINVEGNIIYAISATFLTALHAKDGSVLWQQSLSSHPGAFTVADGIIYLIMNNGYLDARRGTDGGSLWSYKMDKEVSSITPPIVVGGMVYVAALASPGKIDGNDGYVYALQANNGHPVWQYKLGLNVIPAITVGQGMIYVMSRDNLFYALQATTGAILWKVHIP